jgi:hypothetical protein
LTRMPSTQDLALEKLIFFCIIACESDDHLEASRMMIGGILDSAGGFCCVTGLTGAGWVFWV